MAPLLLLAGLDMYVKRKTINTKVSISGIGLHSGIYTRVELHPAHAGSGTTFGRDDVSVGTVEHLLSALMAYGITDLDIHINGPEVPIIDGSALPFMHLIDAAGVRELGADVRVLRVKEPIEVVDGNRSIRITPSNRLVVKYKIDFDHPTIGKQALQFDFHNDSFLKKIAPARTFGFKHEVDKLRAAGLARGGSVENCIVLDDGGEIG